MTTLTSEPHLQRFMVRGLPTRKTDIKEQFQIGLIHAIASAAGCTTKSDSIDAGDDLTVSHQITGLADKCSINFQLKCTETVVNKSGNLVVEMPVQRYDQMREVGKIEAHLLIAQQVAPVRDDWVCVSGLHSEFRAKNYWLNLTGLPAFTGDSEKVTVPVPTTQVFDDSALIQLFAKLRQGELEK